MAFFPSSTNINDTNFGTKVDLSTYTSANPYTCQTDGYAYVECGTAQNDVADIAIMGATGSTEIVFTVKNHSGTYSGCNAVFIRKGLRLYCKQKVGTYSKTQFFPLVP